MRPPRSARSCRKVLPGTGWLLMGLLCAGCGSNTTGVGLRPEPATAVARIANHRFPRLANQVQLCCRTDYTEPLLSELGYWDLVVIDPPVLVTAPEYLGERGAIRTLNPNTIILAYFSAADVNPRWRQPIMDEFAGTVDSSWYLRDVQGRTVPLFEVAPDVWTWSLNLTTPVSHHIPTFIRDRILAGGLVDGVFYDWASTRIAWLHHRDPARSGRLDMNGDGVAEPDSVIDRVWTSGYSEMLAQSRALFPRGTLLVGNGGWGTGTAYDTLLQGVMLEQLLEGERGDPVSYGWEPSMRTYGHYQTQAREPRLSIIMANRDDPENTRFMRFALGSTLLFDGYFAYTNRTDPTTAYQTARWYDEYSVDLTTGSARKGIQFKGYLGWPVTEAFNARQPSERLLATLESGEAAATKVWRRDFQNGIVVVNPSRDAQRLELENTYRKIRGVRDREFNNGSPVKTLVLAPRTAAILLREPGSSTNTL